MSRLRATGAGNVELSLGQAFRVQGHCDLDLWSDDPKINRVHLLARPNLHVKFETIGPGIAELPLEQALVYQRTDIPTTDRPTCAKQYTPLLRMWHNTSICSWKTFSFRDIFHNVKNVFILCYVFPYHFVYRNYFLVTVDIMEEKVALRCCGRNHSTNLFLLFL